MIGNNLKNRAGDRSGADVERCPNCRASDSVTPVVTVDGTTLWRCIRNACVERTWTTESERPRGLGRTPDAEAVLNRLLGAASYHESEPLLELAYEVADLYREAGIDVPELEPGGDDRPVRTLVAD